MLCSSSSLPAALKAEEAEPLAQGNRAGVAVLCRPTWEESSRPQEDQNLPGVLFSIGASKEPPRYREDEQATWSLWPRHDQSPQHSPCLSPSSFCSHGCWVTFYSSWACSHLCLLMSLTPQNSDLPSPSKQGF